MVILRACQRETLPAESAYMILLLLLWLRMIYLMYFFLMLTQNPCSPVNLITLTALEALMFCYRVLQVDVPCDSVWRCRCKAALRTDQKISLLVWLALGIHVFDFGFPKFSVLSL